MAAVISATSICNEALVFLGEIPLLDFPENSQNSDRCAVYYERVKVSELKKHPWNFAKARMELTLDSVNPPFEYAHQFIVPADLLKLVNVYPIGRSWRREILSDGSQRILANTNTLEISYIRDVPESVFCPTFAPVVSARLAMLLAHTLTERRDRYVAAVEWYDDSLSEARRVDSQEMSVDEVMETSVVLVRNNRDEAFFYRPLA